MADNARREALIGHTSLCLMALLGFVLYTSTYSVVYVMKTTGKPVAVVEMWMVMTHLLTSILTCALCAFLDPSLSTLMIAKSQSAVFLGVALTTTGVGTACMQGGAFCSAFFPAAAFPPLAASGSIAWAWVMYIASLSCQSGEAIALGMGGREAVTAACLMGLVVPQVLSTLSETCGGKWREHCSGGSSCSAALNITLLVAALLISNVGHFLSGGMEMAVAGHGMQVLAVGFLWVDILVVLSPTHGFFSAMGVYLWAAAALTIFPLANSIATILYLPGKRNSRTKSNSDSMASDSAIANTRIHFPILNLYNMNNRDAGAYHHIL